MSRPVKIFLKNSSFSGLYLLILLFLLQLLISCDKEVILYPLMIEGITLSVEVAADPGSREQGLMYRKILKDEQGMLFIFRDEKKPSFWMKNTEIPLSLAYISKQGIIREIHDLIPFSKETVPSGRYILYALEVNQGYFQEHDIRVGDKVLFPENLPSAE